MPFRFTQSSRLPSACFLLLDNQWAYSTAPDDWTCYCVHLRVTLGDRRLINPPPSYTWSGSLITDILQEACPGDQITEAVVLVLGEAILFYGRHSLQEGLLYHNAQDVKLDLRGSVNWAGRIVPEEVTINTVQEGHWAIVDTVMEKKMKARGSACPQGSRKATQSSAATCNVDDWMWGLNKGVSDREVDRTDDIRAYKYEQLSTSAQLVGGGGRWHKRQGTHGVPRCFSGSSPSSGGGNSDQNGNKKFSTLNNDGSIQWEQQISACRKRPTREG